MEQPIPILSLEQIDELAVMVREIQAQNQRGLEEQLSERCDLQQTTIINLYHLAAEEWAGKQKVLENLCHFTLTIMNTLHYLWERHEIQQQDLSNCETLIASLQAQLAELNDENQQLREDNQQVRNDLYETHNQIAQLVKQPLTEPIEQTACYKDYEIGPSLKSTPNLLNRECSGCLELESCLERAKSEEKVRSSSVLEQIESEMETLREQNQRLVEEYSLLREEQALTKLEVELAEIAIKDALTYKSSYLEMLSQVSKPNAEGISRLWESRKGNEAPDLDAAPASSVKYNCSQGIFEESEDLCPLNSHILARQVPDYFSENYSENKCCLLENNSKEDEAELQQESLIKIAQEKKTSHQSPHQRSRMPREQLGDSHLYSFAESSIQRPGQSAVILQSSIDLTVSENSSDLHFEPSQSSLYASNVIQLLSRPQASGRKVDMRRRRGRQRLQEGKPEATGEREQSREESTIGRLYNMLSTKLVSNRIRTR